MPTLTATYTGFVNGDTSANLTTTPNLSTPATAASQVSGSPYPITVSGAVDADYNITYVNGTLTVTPVALTITADNQTKAYGWRPAHADGHLYRLCQRRHIVRPDHDAELEYARDRGQSSLRQPISNYRERSVRS